jgi:hypothetical protein
MKRRNGNQNYFRKESNEKGTKSISRRKIMRKEYDFSKMKGRKNSYAKKFMSVS